MAVINTNTKALFTQAALISTERTLSKSMEQLSTGKRINSAGTMLLEWLSLLA